MFVNNPGAALSSGANISLVLDGCLAACHATLNSTATNSQLTRTTRAFVQDTLGQLLAENYTRRREPQERARTRSECWLT